jgi:1-acyl-sn-glycerol-3-phosphate acyltransferase
VEVADRLSNNLNVVIFPEGTRTPHDKPGSIGKGSVLMAKKNDTNVYLVSLDTGKLWKPKGIFIKSGLVTIKVSKNKNFYQKDINESIEEISNYFHSNI